MNLNSVLRITAKVTGVRAFTTLDRSIKKTEKAARAAEKGFKQMLDSRLFRTAAVAAAGLTAAIALSTKAAIDFESSMAEVRKVVDGLENPQTFAEISNEILDLSGSCRLRPRVLLTFMQQRDALESRRRPCHCNSSGTDGDCF